MSKQQANEIIERMKEEVSETMDNYRDLSAKSYAKIMKDGETNCLYEDGKYVAMQLFLDDLQHFMNVLSTIPDTEEDY